MHSTSTTEATSRAGILSKSLWICIFELVYSTIARPQGRGKVERLFGTLNTELLPELPGYLKHGKPTTYPKLSLSELHRAIGTFLIGTYNARTHREIGTAPWAAWSGNGWLPRMPESLEELDLLLMSVAKARTVHRDGIHFQGIRYMDPTLAPYVGEAVTIRYDPRELAEVRVFYRNRFLCRAVSPEHCGQAITLKDIQAARSAHRRALRGQIRERITPVAARRRPSAASAHPVQLPARLRRWLCRRRQPSYPHHRRRRRPAQRRYRPLSQQTHYPNAAALHPECRRPLIRPPQPLRS